jgi:hypothetical protein
MIDYKSDFWENNNMISDDIDYWSHFSSSLTRKKTAEDYVTDNFETKDIEIKFIDVTVEDLSERIINFSWLEKIIMSNNQLGDLGKFPSFFPNLNYFEVSNNKILFLNGDIFPPSLKTLIFTENSTMKIKNLNDGIEILNLSGNNIRNFDWSVPASVIKLNLSSNKFLMKLPIFGSSDNIKELDISDTNIRNIDNLPESVEVLIAYKCNILNISRFPKNLIKLVAYRSGIRTIETQFPQCIKEIDLYDNLLIELPEFPDGVETIDLNNNNLEKIPKFNKTTKFINLKDNVKLPIDEIKTLIEEFKETTIFYTDPSSISMRDQEETNYQYKNSNLRENPSNFNQNLFNYQMMNQRVKSFSVEFDDSNPHYIVLTDTYEV